MNQIPAETATDPIRIKIIIPTNVYFLSGIRNFTLDMARNVAGFDEQWAFRFQTIVDELTNNAIEHGSREGEEIELTFEIERQKSVTITVSDGGHGRISHTASELTEIARAAKEHVGKPSFALRGRGFQIITNWSDSLEFKDNERGGLSATVKKSYTTPEIKFENGYINAKKNVFVLEV